MTTVFSTWTCRRTRIRSAACSGRCRSASPSATEPGARALPAQPFRRRLLGAGAVALALTVLSFADHRSGTAADAPPSVLVVTVTKGYRHASIPDLERVLTEVGREGGAFDVDFARTDTELGAKTTRAALARYQGVVFASTTGDLPLPDRSVLLSWIEAGHAFVGIHAATDTFPGFRPYLEMIGGKFERHGPETRVRLLVRDAGHPATRGLERSFEVYDEIYEFTGFDPARVQLLLALDRHPQTGAPGSFPLAWTREPGRGRVFYTALGHRSDVVTAPWFRQHLRGGILWALRQL
jgi:uncharacterized protein